MKAIPKKLKEQILNDPEYLVCAKYGYLGHVCHGRITLEHAVIYAHNQVQERWAIIPLCAYGHSVDYHQDGGDLNKEINLWIALNRATDDELFAVSKAIDYKRERTRLNQKYGTYESPASLSIIC